MARDWTWLMIHHSAGPAVQTLAQIREQHMRQNGWQDIGYHYLIERDAVGHGHLKTGRSDELPGAHAGVKRWNEQALGLCVVGCFHPVKGQKPWSGCIAEHMSEDLYQTVLAACCWLVKKYGIPADHILGHREARATACPGDWFPLARLKHDVRRAFGM